MKYLDEYRSAKDTRRLARAIAQLTTRPWTIMEICGGQTHSIVKFGLDQLLPEHIELVHGPGCPVCVTPVETIDKAIAIASQPDVIFCSYGDMLRVPGSGEDLLAVKARGGDLRIVHTPLDAVKIAQEHPEHEVVFFAIGFETTAPANAMAAYQARQQDVQNFSMLVSHVLVPPAMDAILGSPDCRVQGFLAAGHVCAVMGQEQYEPLCEHYRTPIVITGFEPTDILHGLHCCIEQLENGRWEVQNAYTRVVPAEGNPLARKMISEVFEISDQTWRGIGSIPSSGLRLRAPYRKLDAHERFALSHIRAQEDPACISGQILQGLMRPEQCPAFGTQCTPGRPLGAPMVSSEGACAAYFRYRRKE